MIPNQIDNDEFFESIENKNMNERIKHLLAKAHCEAVDIKDTNWIANRFAKLIIEEVHEVIVIGGVDDLDVVMKHFGIEE